MIIAMRKTLFFLMLLTSPCIACADELPYEFMDMDVALSMSKNLPGTTIIKIGDARTKIQSLRLAHKVGKFILKEAGLKSKLVITNSDRLAATLYTNSATDGEIEMSVRYMNEISVDEMACVFAHEAGHVALRHSSKLFAYHADPKAFRRIEDEANNYMIAMARALNVDCTTIMIALTQHMSTRPRAFGRFDNL